MDHVERIYHILRAYLMEKAPAIFQRGTTVTLFFDDCVFPVYLRGKMNRTIEKPGHALDNKFVVPYNRDFLLLFQYHIYLEICNNYRSLKYLFKYCLKDHDNATMRIKRKKRLTDAPNKSKSTDEIKPYLDGRYVCSFEAALRTLGYDIHYRYPSVERFPVHVEGGKNVTFKSTDTLENVATHATYRKSKLEAWFVENQRIPEANEYTFQEFPRGFVWDGRACKWKRRQRGIVIGRLSEVHPSQGDTIFLGMLLLRSRGATSF
ncbi:uncharacterized protein LOC141671486 [Apium graveolens]|uniref:uncharacterized protein LOC141671486 n=1 Tax=Apium graveolens TaxID=4045 RepID=UPI003D7BDB8A